MGYKNGGLVIATIPVTVLFIFSILWSFDKYTTYLCGKEEVVDIEFVTEKQIEFSYEFDGIIYSVTRDVSEYRKSIQNDLLKAKKVSILTYKANAPLVIDLKDVNNIRMKMLFWGMIYTLVFLSLNSKSSTPR
jgi:hypothetical protein